MGARLLVYDPAMSDRRRPLMTSLFTTLAFVTGSVACNGSPTPTKPGARRHETQPVETAPVVDAANPTPPTPPAPPAVQLAAEPRIDLLDNRFRFHLYDEGLLVALASEGLRKYTQEYRRPWGGLVTLDSRVGRVLENDRATVRVPWGDSGVAFLRVRAHGVVKGQHVMINVNGKRAGVAKLETAWQMVNVPVKAGLLRAGENEILVRMTKRGRAGGKRTYGLLHSLELVAGGETERETWPALTPVAEARGDAPAPALVGFGKLLVYVELPQNAWLSLSTAALAGNPRFRVTATTVDGQTHKLLDVTARDTKWRPHQISLAAFANRLVALELAVEGDASGAAWGAPTIQLEAAESRARPKPYQNAILMVVDALRSDRLALYGETRVETPRITSDGRAGGVVFLRNQAASPSSPPANASIQTGMTPRLHGVGNDTGQLRKGTPMLSTQLRAAGISAAYYGNNSFAMKRLKKPGNWSAFHEPNFEGKGLDCKPLIAEILKYARAESEAKRRFVVTSITFETHVPYRYHKGITDRYYGGPWKKPPGKRVNGDLLGAISFGRVRLDERGWQQLKALYDGEAEYFDGCFAQLRDGLEELGIADQTAVLLGSDHGEGMFEHGRMGHAFGHYAELADVPLVIYADGLVEGGHTVETVTSHLDIVPTILDLVGVDVDPRVQGRSLLPLLLRRGPWTPRVVPIEYGRSYALRAWRWKYIVSYSDEEALFDLETDPTEQKELSAAQPMALRYMRELAGFYLAHRKQWRMKSWGPLNNHGPGFLEYVGTLAP